MHDTLICPRLANKSREVCAAGVQSGKLQILELSHNSDKLNLLSGLLDTSLTVQKMVDLLCKVQEESTEGIPIFCAVCTFAPK